MTSKMLNNEITKNTDKDATTKFKNYQTTLPEIGIKTIKRGLITRCSGSPIKRHEIKNAT